MPRDENGVWPMWLSPQGKAYECGHHAEFICDDLEYIDPELHEEFREWHFSDEYDKHMDLYKFLHDKGWWKKSKNMGKWQWMGTTPATPQQRRYINNDIGERQSNDFFKGI